MALRGHPRGGRRRLSLLAADEPHLLLGGDEAILGLMAKHLAEARDVPFFFFYGQVYGLPFFEAAAGVVAFRLAGVGDVQLKLAMLAIWLV